MFQSAVNWGYEQFRGSQLSRSAVAVRVARAARDVLFHARVLAAGDAGKDIVETSVLDDRLYVTLEDSGVSRTLYLNGIYEPNLTRACPDLVEPGDTVVDVGANIGYFTVLFSELVGETGSVYAYEPDPRNFELLQRNIDLRNCQNVTSEMAAVADTAGVVEFTVSDDQFSRSRFTRPDELGDGVTDVEAVRLDDHLAEPVEVLKVDVVGAELQVLRGALSLITTHRPRIVLPLLPEKWAERDHDVFDELDSLGYRPESLDGDPLEWQRALDADRRQPTQNVVLEPSSRSSR